MLTVLCRLALRWLLILTGALSFLALAFVFLLARVLFLLLFGFPLLANLLELCMEYRQQVYRVNPREWKVSAR